MKIIILSFIISSIAFFSVSGQNSQKAEPSLKLDKNESEQVNEPGFNQELVRDSTNLEPTDDVEKRLFITNGVGDTVFVNSKNGTECELSFSFLNGIKRVVFDCGKKKIFLYNPVRQMIKRKGFTGDFYEIFQDPGRIGFQKTDKVDGVNMGFFIPDEGSVWQLLSTKICGNN